MPTSPTAPDDDARWAAVVARDGSQDGCFWYSVSSTGIYCRPSCPARRPKREHVAFHASPAAAEGAGFRPCRRCHPDQPPPAQRNATLVAQACRLIDTAENEPTLTQLAAAVGLSPWHFQRLFKAVAGLTPKAYAQARRHAQVRAGLGEGSDSVTTALHSAGFGSAGRFYATAGAFLGMPPQRFRAGGSGVELRFAVGQCSLGAILVAASDRGLCAIDLGDDPETLLRNFQDRFPRARLIGGDRAFEQSMAQVIALVDQPRRGLDLPLDIRGTAFQHRVWTALRALPPGSTISYSELAARIGNPAAVRAVAGACAANTLAVAIPCHRVVRSDGGLSGYRWGIARKRLLLEREAAPECGRTAEPG